jgi:hypothetical protein
MSKSKQTVFPSLDSDDDFERICAILSPDKGIDEDEEFDPPELSARHLSRYYDFLLPQLPVGLHLTGDEPLGHFAWEERFVWGHGSPEDHKKAKQFCASFEDTFELLSLLHSDKELGLLVNVRRLEDQKTFKIPLVDLKACDPDSAEYQLIDDYGVWFVNFNSEGF